MPPSSPSLHQAGVDPSNALLRAIIESAVDYAIISMDLGGVVTSWNEGASQILGWSAEEICGLPADLIFTPEDRATGVPQAEMSNALLNGRGVDERWHQRRDGSRFWASGEMLPLHDEAGKPIGFLKILRDRTAQKHQEEEKARAAQALSESEAYLRLAIDAGQMAIWDLDIATQRLAGSPELSRLFGFPEDAEPSLEEVRARYYPGERKRLQAIGQAALERGDHYAEAEFRCIWPDGSMHWLMLRAEIYRNKDGSPRRYLGVLLDVSRRKAAEAQFERSEALKSAILQTSLDCIVTINKDSRVIEWNEAAEDTFGISRASAVGRDLSTLIIPHELRDAHHDGMKNYLATGEGPLLGKRVEVEALRANGSTLPVELAISPVSVGDGQYFTAFLRDITARKEDEAQRQLLTQELAHRVKNTLAMVQAIVSQTLRQSEDVDAAKGAVEARLSALARAHDSLISADWSRSPIADVVDGALKPYRAGDNRFHITGPDLDLDAKQALGLSLALHELATNATKYGALSSETGNADIFWQFDDSKPETGFRFEWKERGGPTVEKPVRIGFGSRMIERSLAGYFNGTTAIAYEPDGLRFVLEAPWAGRD